jgi:hypothetical protein
MDVIADPLKSAHHYGCSRPQSLHPMIERGIEMRVRGIIFVAVTLSFTLVLGAFQALHAAPQAALTEATYASTMTEIDLTVKDAETHLDATYWEDLGVDTDRLRALLGQVQGFWTARQAQPAVGFSEQAVAAAYALGQASGTQDNSAARQAMSDLKSACSACHMQYRERTDAGFRIKPGT